MIRGNVKVTKTYKNGEEEILFDDSNIVTDGLGYSLVNIFTRNGSTDVEDHQIAYFQVGNNRRDLSSVDFFVKNNFYSLSSAFSESDYGLESPLLLKTTPQVMVEVDEEQPYVPTEDLVYFVSAGIFASLDKMAYTSFEGSDVIRHRITLDEDTGNGKTIRELGLFMRNPDGATANDRAILAAYRSLENPINKTAQFSVTIDWSFTFGLETTTANPTSEEDLTFLSQNYSYLVQVLSGTGNAAASLGTGDDYDEYFLVNTPATYDIYPSGTPLVVGCHDHKILGLGLSGTTINALATSGIVSGILPEKVLDNNWFMVHPCLGKNAATIFAFTPGDNAAIDHGNTALDQGLWNEKVGLNHIKLAVSWMKSQYPIDTKRIYMWGHSTGGVAPITCAAKLLDPTKDFMVAGIVSDTPAGLNYDYLFRHSIEKRRNRLRFWTSGQGRVSYIPLAETGNNYQGLNWSSISGLDVTGTPGSTSSFLPEFQKNSAFVFLHDNSAVSANVSIAKNIRHIPLAISYGDADNASGNLAFVSGIQRFNDWAVCSTGSGLDHPNYLHQLRLSPAGTHSFNDLSALNGATMKSYFDTAWDHVSANTLSFPTSGEYCIYNSQRVFNVLANVSSTEWDAENCGAGNFFFEDEATTVSSTLSALNNIASFQHFGIPGSPLRPVEKLKTNRTTTLHLYEDTPSQVTVNGVVYKETPFKGANKSNPNLMIGALLGDPYDFGGPAQKETGNSGGWIFGPSNNVTVRNNGSSFYKTQFDPYSGYEWDFVSRDSGAAGQVYSNNLIHGKADVGSIVENTFTFSVYFQLINVSSVDVSLAMFVDNRGNWGVGGNSKSNDGIVMTSSTISTNTVETTTGAIQGLNNWQRVSHTVKYPTGPNVAGTVLHPVIILGNPDNLDTFPAGKRVAISHAKLEVGDTVTDFADNNENTSNIYWEYNKQGNTLLLSNRFHKAITWEITP